jgi:ribose transport system ATP-binding protein
MKPLLRAADISKRFPGVEALANVDFDVLPGEVHAVVGENGAGKSTLMHILAGVQQPDKGSVEFDGPPSVAIVYQERSLFGLLSVADNLFVKRQPVNRFGVIDRTALAARAREVLARVNLEIEPGKPVGQLSPAQQQMVEIAKALSIDARVLILDEPTAALTFSETETLFRLIGHLKAAGVGVVYISHRLEEVFRIADRVTVLKDGRRQGTFGIAETSPDHLVSKMVGRERIHEPLGSTTTARVSPALEVRNLSDGLLRSVSLTAWPGEVLALAGLAGAGRTELALALFGERPVRSGEIRVGGSPVKIRSPQDAIAAGIGYVTEDRMEMGLFREMSIAGNIAAAHLDRFGQWWLRSEDMDRAALDFIRRLRIACAGADQPVARLSGGNQQKVLLARWLLRDPKVLIVDEPTRGIDVGAKAEVHAVLRGLAAAGKAVVVISSDLPEVLALADRVVVMRQGRIAAEFTAAEATEESIMRAAAMDREGPAA